MKHFSIDDVIQALQIEETIPGEWRGFWTQSEASFQPASSFFLKPSYLSTVIKRLEFQDDIHQALASTLPLFEKYPELERLCWHFHLLLFGEFPNVSLVPVWPVMNVFPVEKAGLIKAVTLLSGIAFLEKVYAQHQISDKILKDTLLDMDIWMRDFKTRHGYFGFNQYEWLGRSLKAQIFRLGRLQFEFKKIWFPIRAYRHPHHGVIVLSEEKQLFRADGQFASADGLEPGPDAWESVLEEGEGWVQGTVISPCGKAIRKSVRLDLNEWKEILRRDDDVLSVHIPAIGPMDFNACGQSYESAVSFFERHFPDFKYKAFVCWSWLLDPQFEAWLPSDSNTVKFLREYYLIPLPKAEAWAFFDRVFLSKPMPPDDLPQKTSMQRSLVSAMKQGVSFREAGFLLFKEDLRWGQQVYRKMPAQDLLR